MRCGGKDPLAFIRAFHKNSRVFALSLQIREYVAEMASGVLEEADPKQAKDKTRQVSFLSAQKLQRAPRRVFTKQLTCSFITQ